MAKTTREIEDAAHALLDGGELHGIDSTPEAFVHGYAMGHAAAAHPVELADLRAAVRELIAPSSRIDFFHSAAAIVDRAHRIDRLIALLAKGGE